MANFNAKVAKEIAEISFGHVLDCILGYCSGYDLGDESSEFEQNFEEALLERGIPATEGRIKKVSIQFDKMRNSFIEKIRKKYYT